MPRPNRIRSRHDLAARAARPCLVELREHGRAARGTRCPAMSSAPSESDLHFLHEAVRLGMNGRGAVEPNPMVGCVLVKEGRIIGEGFHTHFGGPHAEPAALSAA